MEHGFLYHQGEFVNYDYPGATNTQLDSIHSSNLAVGTFFDSQGYTNGFQWFNGIGGVT